MSKTYTEECWTCCGNATHKEWRDALNEYEYTCNECHKEEYSEQYEDEEDEEEEENTTDALTFVAWSEDAEGMNCWTCGKENAEDYCEGHDNICKICASKWIYDEEGSKGEGYYLKIDIFIRQNFWMEQILHTFAEEVFENNHEEDVGLNEEIFIQRFKIVLRKHGVLVDDPKLLENFVERLFYDDEEEESETESELAEKYERWEEEEEEDLKEDLKARRLERLKKELEWGLKD